MLAKVNSYLSLLSVAVLVLSGCSFNKTLTAEEALQKDRKDQIFNPRYSVARNICNYYDIFCPKDVVISKADLKKALGKTSDKGVGNDIAQFGGIYFGSSLVFPSSFASQTHQLGAGWFFLASGLLLSVLEPSDWKYPEVLAFIPISKAKTEKDARKFFLSTIDKAEMKVIEANKFEIVKSSEFSAEKFFDGTYSGFIRYVKGKNICPLSKEGNASCRLGISVKHSGINAVQTIIPEWLPNAGEKVWRISDTNSLFVVDAESGGKNFLRDMVLQISKYLPDNFYLYIPANITGDKQVDSPAVIVSNKRIYPFINVKD